jgi:hypothetical protein
MLFVGRFEGGRHLNRQAKPFFESERATGHQVGKRLTIEVLHDEVVHSLVSANVVQRTDMGMGKGRDGARFTLEPIAKFLIGFKPRREDFDRHGAIEAYVACSIDFTHTTSAEQGADLVRAEPSASQEGHGKRLQL